MVKSITFGYLLLAGDNNGELKEIRGGTTFQLSVDGYALWIFSVHRKSSCAKTKSIDTSKSVACQVLWKQRVPIDQWIEKRVSNDEYFVIAGDFNRRFRKLQLDGKLWDHLNEGDRLLAYPTKARRLCPTKKGDDQPIDWILVDADLKDKVVPGSYREIRFTKAEKQKHGRRLSDHCPIRLDIALP